jgi:hypothetical protein
MSTQITTAFIRDFKEGITLLAQQKMSRLRRAVRVEMINGDRGHFDQVGSVTAQPVTARHADTPIIDTPHSRRQVTLTPYKHADLIDDADKVRILNNPQSTYMRAFAAAFGRRMDQVIIDAALATASTGADGSGTAAHPGGDFQITSTTGMTVDKLLQAKQVLDENENDPEQGYWCIMGAEQIRDLLTDTAAGSGGPLVASSMDYAERKALVTGDITKFGGFNIIRSQLLNTEAGGDRQVLAWAAGSMVLGIGENPNARISERADKNYSTQVFYSMDIGATRMDETGVVEIHCAEA